MRIGVTSQNFKTITGHAGKSRRFIIFESDDKGEVVETDRLDLPKSMSIHETLPSSPHPLDELDVLVSQSGGGGFQRKMQTRGVQLVLTSASDPLEAAMALASGEQLPPAEIADGHHHDHGDGGVCCGGGGGHEHNHGGGGGCCGH